MDTLALGVDYFQVKNSILDLGGGQEKGARMGWIPIGAAKFPEKYETRAIWSNETRKMSRINSKT